MPTKPQVLRALQLMDIALVSVLSRDTRLRILQDKTLHWRVRFHRSVPNRPHHHSAVRQLIRNWLADSRCLAKILAIPIQPLPPPAAPSARGPYSGPARHTADAEYDRSASLQSHRS